MRRVDPVIPTHIEQKNILWNMDVSQSFTQHGEQCMQDAIGLAMKHIYVIRN